MSKTYSLKNRLIAWISLPILILSLVTFTVGYGFSWYEIEEVYDAQLAHFAKLIYQLTKADLAHDDIGKLDLNHLSIEHDYERNLGFRIWKNEVLIAQSGSTESFDFIPTEHGYASKTINNLKWRFFVYIDPVDDMRVEISERYDVRYELIIQLMSTLLFPEAIFVPIIFLIIWFCVKKNLQPIITTSRYVDQRKPDHLADPIHTESLPEEVLPLVTAINRLFKRIQQSIELERKFIDYAAHELRTPLAAMKMQTQVILKKSKRIPDCESGLINLKDSIDRSVHLVNQLLTLSKYHDRSYEKQSVDLATILSQIIFEYRPLAHDKNVSIVSSICSKVMINGHSSSIEVLIKNIIDNALKYTPQGGTINIVLNDNALLKIADTGCGITNAQKSRAFEKFVRFDKSGQPGSGLGLSIVKWIADAYKLVITLEDNTPRGLIVSIQWPKEDLLVPSHVCSQINNTV